MNTQVSSGEHPKQEPSDLRPRAVLLVAASVIVMVLVVAFVAHLLSRAPDATRAGPGSTGRGPRLTSNPEEDITAFERRKRLQLETYGWADREHAFARIPIEQAMQKLVTRQSTGQGRR
jgi:hypothetical protein